MAGAMQTAQTDLAAQTAEQDLLGIPGVTKNDGIPAWVYLVGLLLVGALVALLAL
jgi:hypothetical protein